MALIAAFEGFLSQGSLVELLERVLESHGPMLVAARAEQEERAFNRRIREEQEQAFAEALAEDQRREREREAEREQEREREEQLAHTRPSSSDSPHGVTDVTANPACRCRARPLFRDGIQRASKPQTESGGGPPPTGP